MAKKYLSLEEAAAQLGMSVDDLKQLREAGEIRGFSDRGTWKFRPEDITELFRRRQADSSPSVPILDDDDLGAVIDSDDEGSSVLLGGESSVVLSDEEDDVGQQATIVRKQGDILGGNTSDSDVRLVLDDSLTTDSDPDVIVPKEKESDSDVRLADDSAKPQDSDSDVKFVGDASDSDVKLMEEPSGGTIAMTPSSDSDSDVQLVSDDSELVLESPGSEHGSDSDVKLIGSDIATDDDIQLAPLEDKPAAQSAPSILEEEDSGITLDSGVGLEAGDSGIALESADDSGLSLEGLEDSGIALEAEEDSGISLATDDSGISLSDATDSGISLGEIGEGVGSGDFEETQLEIESFDDDSEFELSASDTGSDTGVIVFDDDEEIDEHGATMVRKSAGADSDEFGSDEFASDEFSGSEEFEFDDDLEVAEDVIGEDDELDDMDVFDAGDEDFAESFEAGESHADFIAPQGAVAAPVQHDWGIVTVLGLFLTTALMGLCVVVMFDFIRSMWSWQEPTGFTSSVMKSLAGLFKK